MHRYHISYSAQQGHGSCAFNRETPITTWNDVQDIKRAIEMDQEIQDVVIHGWQKFEDA